LQLSHRLTTVGLWIFEMKGIGLTKFGLLIVLASPVWGQGVPIVDGTRLSNAISRLSERARDFTEQGTKLTTRDEQSTLEQDQLDAFERFLKQTTGTTDISGFETGGGGMPGAAATFPIEEDHPDQQRLFGDNASVEQMIITTAARYENHAGVRRVGLTPTTWRILFQSLIKQESRFNNAAVSHVGARGFCQLMPGTAADLGVDPRDPWQNLDGGARYIATQLNTYGRIDHALAAYNAGPGNVNKYGGIPPFEETQNYVRRIRGYYDEYLSIITGADMTGSLNGIDGANAAWGNWADASNGYGAYQSGQVDQAMRRVSELLRQAKPNSAKQAVDHNTYMMAERARLMALTLRMRAAHVKVEAAAGMNSAAQDLQYTTFWEFSDEG
tara:strand:- start:12858 stop:14012 length:1155 start_codon:yes stop_codon:yes gene_type:complete